MKYTKALTLMLASVLVFSGCKLFKENIPSIIGNNTVETEVQQIVKIEDTIKWIYGGFNGSKGKYAGPATGKMIKDLKLSATGMSYSWAISETEAAKLLNSAFKTEANLLACFFVKNKSGDIVGGKFEWISVSRKTREFKNIFKSYNGWTLKDIPNTTDAYFCIINPKTLKRTNFIKGTWIR